MQQIQKIIVGVELPREDLLHLLENFHYQRREFVAKPGEFAFRGATFDLYPLTYRLPVRLEFERDTLVSIHDFSHREKITFALLKVAPHVKD